MLSPAHLKTLQEVLRCESFAAAANRLGYTASAVSQQMAALERAVGVVLFERTARNIHPTPAAHILCQMGAKVLLDLEAIPEFLVRLNSPVARKIGLGIFPSAALNLLPLIFASRLWRDFRADMNVQVGESSELIKMLVEATSIDLVLVYQFDRSSLSWPSFLRTRSLCRDPLIVLLPAAWARQYKPSPTLCNLAKLPWISNLPGTAGALAIDRIWSQKNLSPRVVARSDDYAVTTELVRGGVGAAIVPSMVARNLSADVEVRRPADLTENREIISLMRDGPQDPLLLVLEDLFVTGLAGPQLEAGAGRDSLAPD